MDPRDPRERADATLARARARGAFVVTPESAISPMDATSTLQIPRSLVSAIDNGDPEATMVVPAVSMTSNIRGQLTDEAPAITQEASTQMLANPVQRRPAETPPWNRPPMSWAPPPAPAPPAEPEHVEGLVPTVKPVPTNRSRLSQRLDG